MVTLFRIKNALVGAALLLVPITVTDAVRANETQSDAVPQFSLIDAEELHCMALNIYWEARGEGRTGMEAVAHVTMNRVRDKAFPSSICEVVQQGGSERPGKCQFSWWCDGNGDTPYEVESWKRARYIGWAVMTGRAPLDPTDGALFYHHESIEPTWVASLETTTQIGAHIFYR